MKESLSFLVQEELGSAVLRSGVFVTQRNDLQGKDGSTLILQDLTNDLARMNAQDNVSGVRMGGSKGQPLTAVAEAGVKDTGSNGYR